MPRTNTYEVKHHKGRSGRSVYEWRVYHVFGPEYRRMHTQLGKYRTRERAEKAAEHHRANAERVAALRAARACRGLTCPAA